MVEIESAFTTPHIVAFLHFFLPTDVDQDLKRRVRGRGERIVVSRRDGAGEVRVEWAWAGWRFEHDFMDSWGIVLRISLFVFHAWSHRHHKRSN